jgi:hypothetical protein
MNQAEQFFYDHAGYSWDRAHGQTEEDGHRQCARELAAAEQARKNADAWVTWEPDPEGDANGQHPAWVAMLHRWRPNGAHVETAETVSSLGGIDSGPGSDYARVIEAQLSLEL